LYALALGQADGKVILYAGTNVAGVYRSDDEDSTWKPVNNNLTDRSIRSLAVDPRNGQAVYAGTANSGVFRSENAGDLWNPPVGEMGARKVRAIAVSPSASDLVYAGTQDHGVYRSADGGQTWEPMNTGLGKGGQGAITVYSLAFDPRPRPVHTGHTLYAGTNGDGVYVLYPEGTTWQAINTGLGNRTIRPLAMGPAPKPVLYAGTKSGVWWSHP
jgi:photosystem II stability/assembly factor-like uncharacterized protein